MTTSPASAAPRAVFVPHASARMRAIEIAPRKRAAQARPAPKHVGLVLRPGMNQDEYRRVERRLEENRLAALPIVVGVQAKRAQNVTPICGLIIVGSNGPVHAAERRGLEAVVLDAMRRGAPILALSDAAPTALSAIGGDSLAPCHDGVLIDGGVEGLAYHDIDRVIDRMAASAPQL